MHANDVLLIYNELTKAGVQIWIDGGWCVDALLEKETRHHADLDIAVAHKHEVKLKEVLYKLGMREEPTNDESAWNYVMKHDDQRVDVHIFEYDHDHNNMYGIKYPYGSLTGQGVINGQKVNCIAPEWMYKFKTAYKPKTKDIADVKALASVFGYDLPARYAT